MGTCGGKYVTRVEDGMYEVTCETCRAMAAAGPAADVHWASQVWADQRCERKLPPPT